MIVVADGRTTISATKNLKEKMNKFKPRKFSCYTGHQKKKDA